MNALAALTNFFIPGLGHLIQGRPTAAFFVFGAFVMLLLITLLTFGLGLLVLVPFEFWAIYDAAVYRPPQQLGRYRDDPRWN